MTNRLIVGVSHDPWYNLALEERLMDTCGDGATLYLWQNENTVGIGRAQNAWRECRVRLLEDEGGRLARRSSGGGAVYHDLGNLNFSFVLPRPAYDLGRQLSVIVSALSAFGVRAEVSGRNDLVLDSGEKFSGNAFRFTQGAALHHGTLLVSADMDKLSRYLAPSEKKLAAKGVTSVRARVTNLADVAPGLTVPLLTDALMEAFGRAYGAYTQLMPDAFDRAAVAALTEKYASWDWRFGKTPAFDVSLCERFDWGELELLLACRHGCVDTAHVFTDAMDPALSERLSAALTGAPFTPAALSARVAAVPGPEARSLAVWLGQQSL